MTEEKKLYLNKKLGHLAQKPLKTQNLSISHLLKKYNSSKQPLKYGSDYECDLQKYKYGFKYDKKTKHLYDPERQPVFKIVNKNPDFKYQYDDSEDEEEE